MNGAGLLADFVFWDIVHAWTSTGDTRTEALIMFGAVFLVSIIAFAAAIFFNQRRRRRRRHHRHGTNPEGKPESRRRRRSEEFPLNPTLAETGGLPPARPEDKLP